MRGPWIISTVDTYSRYRRYAVGAPRPGASGLGAGAGACTGAEAPMAYLPTLPTLSIKHCLSGHHQNKGAELLKLIKLSDDGLLTPSPPNPKAATTGPSAAHGHYLGRCAPASHRAQPRQFRKFIFSSPSFSLFPHQLQPHLQLQLPINNIFKSLGVVYFFFSYHVAQG